MPEIPGVTQVLELLAQGVGAGFVLAFMAEKVSWFQDLPAERKSAVVFLLSVGLPLAAQLLLQLTPPDFWAAIQPYWNALAAGFIGWAGSQAAYLGIIKPAQRDEGRR